MTRPGNPLQRTWDGQPVSEEPPYGAAIIVYCWAGTHPQFLVLHRGHDDVDLYVDWTWGPPSGARYPQETIHD